jgi:hypothetical protein
MWRGFILYIQILYDVFLGLYKSLKMKTSKFEVRGDEGSHGFGFWDEKFIVW